jgi:hypothetical protein
VWSQPPSASSTDPSQTIESDAVDITQSGTWTSQNTPNASGGSYLYSSGNANDTLSLEFYGTRIEVVYVAHPSFGSFTVEIDNNEIRTVTAESKETLFDQRAVFDYLDAGPHTLRIIGVQGVVGIDAFLYSSSISSSTPTPAPTLGIGVTERDENGATTESLSVIWPCNAEQVIVSNTQQLVSEVERANTGNVAGYPHCIYLTDDEFVLTETLVIDRDMYFYGRGHTLTTIKGDSSFLLLDIQSANVLIHSIRIEGGSGPTYAGAINNVSSGSLELSDSYIASNTAVSGGGGVFNNNATLIVRRTTFYMNTAGGGGAIQNYLGELDIENTCFEFNSADYGGALLSDLHAEDEVVIHTSNFVGNTFSSPSGGGGAIYNLATPEINAIENYWGGGTPAPDGPGVGNYNTINGNVNVGNGTPGPGGYWTNAQDCSAGPVEPLPQTATCRVTLASSDPIDGVDQKYAYNSPVVARTERIQYPDKTDDGFDSNKPRNEDRTHLPNILPVEGSQVIVPTMINAGEELTLDGVYSRNEQDDGFTAHIVEIDEQQVDLWINTLTYIAPLEGEDCSQLQPITVSLSPVETIIEDLRAYGIEVSVDGNLWGDGEPQGLWTFDQINDILTGVTNSVSAFQLHSGSTDSLQQIFFRVMIQGDVPDHMVFIQTNQSGFCQTIQGSNASPPTARRVLCRNDVSFTPHTVVHELGHIFDNRSARAPGTSLSDRLNERQIVDCLGQPVLGPDINSDFQRGETGWGSGSELGFSLFQQNILNVQYDPINPIDTDQTTEIGEAAADMFLNWVYRRNTDTDIPNILNWNICNDITHHVDGQTGTHTWEGFLNIDWATNSSVADMGWPGNARFKRMEVLLTDIFGEQQWN